MTVDIDRLPVAFRSVVDLVVDAHVRPLLVVRVPPLPGLHVVVRVREIVDALDGFEVADVHAFALRFAIGGVDPGCHAHEAKLFVVSFQVFDHLREELADLFDSWGEDAQGMVVAEADDEHRDAHVCGLVAVVSFRVRERGGELLHDQVVHHGVVLPASSHCGSVGGGEDDPYYRGQKSDAAYEEEGEGLSDAAESEPCGDGQLLTE